MASSSSMSMRCFHCKVSSDTFIPGWRLRNGGFAMLCLRCGYAFNDGTLCETFHPEESGWRECVSCKKKIHCGCIMAAHTYTILDSTGVQCMECAINESLAPHRCSLHLGRPEAFLQATDSPQIPSADPEKMITGVNPISPPDCLVRNAPPKMVANPTTPGHQSQSPPAETEEEDSVNSPGENKNTHWNNGGKRRKGGNKRTQIQNKYSPKISTEELREICRQSKSSLVPLFEKELTFSDAESRNGRLLLPKRCAEAYFPKTSGQQGIFLMLQDTNGNAWKLHFRYWTNNCGKMYVLEGLRDYKIQMKWEAGDTVRFYKREADGQLVMGFKKNQAPVVVVKLQWFQSRFHGQLKDA